MTVAASRPGIFRCEIAGGFDTVGEHLDDVVQAPGEFGAQLGVRACVQCELGFQRCPAGITDDAFRPASQRLEPVRFRDQLEDLAESFPRISSSTAAQSSSLSRKFEYTAPFE
jgi:hypothetical protein